MELSTSEEIDAPIDVVFAKLNAVETLEGAAVRRGAKVQHREGTPRQGVGTAWDAVFALQGKERDVKVEITQIEAPTMMHLNMNSRSVEGEMAFALTALSETRTRLTVSLAVRPLTLTTRLLLKSLSLAQNGIDQKFQSQVAQIVDEFANQRRSEP